jgi:hypothetical protein
MTRWFPLFILLWCAGAWSATRTFTDAGDHLWGTAGNWDTPPVSGDSCQIASGTCSTAVAVHVRSINVAGSANFSFSTVSDTVDSVFRWGSSGILRHSTGSALVVNGTGNGGIFIANSGTLTTSLGAWILHGNDSISIKKNITILSLDAADSSKTTNYVTATAALSIAGTAVNPLRLHGGAFNLYGNNNLTINSTVSGSLISYSAGSTFGGTITGNIRIYPNAASKAITVPSITATAGVFLAQMQYAGNSDTIGLAGNLNITGTIGIGGRTTNTGHQFNSNGYSITASKALTIDAATGVSTGSFAAAFSNSAVACSVFTHTGPTSTGTQTITFGSSAWTVKDAFTLASAGTGTVTTSWSEGGSLTFITNTANKTITSNGHSFQDIILNYATTQKLTLQDSLQADTVTITSGNFDANAKNIRLTGSFLNNSTTSTDTCLLNNTMTFANNATFKMAWKGIKGVLTSLVLSPLNNLNTWLGEHCRTISRLTMVSGKTWTGHAHDTLAIQNYTSVDWNGSIWRSDTAGAYTYDSLPTAAGPVINVRDVYNTGVACTPDTTSSNYGHTWGFVWPPPRIAGKSKDTIATAGGDTVSITGKYFGLDGLAKVRFDLSDFSYSIQRNDTLLRVVTPAHAAGTVNVYVVTSDTGYLAGNRDTTTIVYYTPSACTYDTLARMYGVTNRKSYALAVPCSTLAKMTCDSVKVYFQIRSLTNMTWQTRDSTAWTKTVLKDTLRATYLQADKAYYLRLRSIAKNNAYIDTLSTRSARTRLSP